MILARVLAAAPGQGTFDLKMPPEGCDCAVDNLSSPTIFVVFGDDEAYPEYIIEFSN